MSSKPADSHVGCWPDDIRVAQAEKLLAARRGRHAPLAGYGPEDLALAQSLSHPWHSTSGEHYQWRFAGLIQAHAVIEPIGSGPDVSIGRSRVPLKPSTEDDHGVGGRTACDGR